MTRIVSSIDLAASLEESNRRNIAMAAELQQLRYEVTSLEAYAKSLEGICARLRERAEYLAAALARAELRVIELETGSNYFAVGETQ